MIVADTGLSSAALGGLVGGVFVAVVLLVCVVLWGFVCWNNYQDSREYNHYGGSKYNARQDTAAQDSANDSSVVFNKSTERGLSGGPQLTTIAECPKEEA